MEKTLNMLDLLSTCLGINKTSVFGISFSEKFVSSYLPPNSIPTGREPVLTGNTDVWRRSLLVHQSPRLGRCTLGNWRTIQMHYDCNESHRCQSLRKKNILKMKTMWYQKIDLPCKINKPFPSSCLPPL